MHLHHRNHIMVQWCKTISMSFAPVSMSFAPISTSFAPVSMTFECTTEPSLLCFAPLHHCTVWCFNLCTNLRNNGFHGFYGFKSAENQQLR